MQKSLCLQAAAPESDTHITESSAELTSASPKHSSTSVKPRQHICAMTERVCFALGSKPIKNKSITQFCFGALVSQLFFCLHRANKNKMGQAGVRPCTANRALPDLQPLALMQAHLQAG